MCIKCYDAVVSLRTGSGHIIEIEDPGCQKQRTVVNCEPFRIVMLCLTVLLSRVRPLYGFLEGLACRENKLGGESYRVGSGAVSRADGQHN